MKATVASDKRISIAPMMDWTDRHCRYFHRLLAPSLWLYTEMVTTGAIIFGKDEERFLGFNETEHPVALQLGGSDPEDLATCCKKAEKYGYDEINLNCGCPSDRVQSGSFGACLMNDPQLVGQCITNMRDSVDIPVTVKCRIGIDDCEEYEFLERFIETVSREGCETFIIHARKAWLQGLSPKENREIPPLQYDIVERIKQNFPHLTVEVNGGIRTIEQIKTMLNLPSRPQNSEGVLHGDFNFDGVMIGREAYQNPWFLREIEEEIFGTANLLSAEDIIEDMVHYIAGQQQKYGTPVKSVTRHMTGLFQGMPGARRWRQILSTEVHKPDTKPEILKTALEEAFSA
jgi:tRNA-dihydrouridine synthase A